MSMSIKEFYDPATFTISYVVADPTSGHCAVIDPVLDFDPASGRVSETSAQTIIDYVREQNLTVVWILETHAHADHLSGAQVIQRELGGKIGIGDHITVVQEAFSKLFGLGQDFAVDGRQFDHLFSDEEEFSIGGLTARVLYTPGHTPACVSYLIGGACFVGDTLFMPDYGTARADFPGGNARTLYQSIQRILALPPETRLFMCHDYLPGGRDVQWETTVGAQRQHNIMIHDGIDEAQFVTEREARDAQLAAPRLILPSLQVNIAAGELPEPESNGIRYLKLPLNKLGGG